jgi:succinate dehydrogenase / fumarate reductase, flavoprotein subunit
VDDGAVDEAIRDSLSPFDRGSHGENPYNVQQDLQDTMQNLVGIVRTEAEMQEALVRIEQLKERSARLGAEGHREYHSGWHTSIDVRNLLSVSEAITRSAIERKESRGGHFREDYPARVVDYGTINIMVKQVPGNGMLVSRVPIPPMPEELKQVIEEQKT